MARLLATLVPLFLLAGCAGTEPPPESPITVEGRTSVRGNEPFAEYVLQTDSRNTYVLAFEDGADAPPNPARLRVTGTLYLADWNGRPYAHLRVQSWERAEG